MKMAEIYKVASIEDAVELAYQFKEEGKYNWFRGQVVDYLPHSSLYRRLKEKEEAEQAKLRYGLFCNWLESIDELKYLLVDENVHQLEAIMQHYGIPTHYVDFTTEPSVAGFFASDTKNPPVDKNSCIYCLDIDDLIGLVQDIKSIDMSMTGKAEKIVIDVNNLWRLQAQHGVFLLCDYNLEVHYDLDKIVFPYSGYPSYPTRDIIYPNHKSSLELLLDQYFVREKAYMFQKSFKERGGMVYEYTAPPEGIHLSFFKENFSVQHLNSWSQVAEHWSSYKTESYHSTSGLSKEIAFSGTLKPEGIRRQASYAVRQILRSGTDIRNRVIDWNIKGLDEKSDVRKIADLLKIVWNGMRLLPFSDDEISEACGNSLFIYLDYINNNGDNNFSERDSFSKMFGKNMEVGFTTLDGSSSVGYASMSSLLDAVELDIIAVIKDEFVKDLDDIRNLLQMVYNPKIVFNFNKFRSIFAKQIIPSQVVFDGVLVLFNPAKITIFGIP